VIVWVPAGIQFPTQELGNTSSDRTIK
jgi:hypothetical protein